MPSDRWETLRRSVQAMRDNSKRFAEQSLGPVSMGMWAQVEVLDIVLNEMATIEQSDA